MIYSTPRRRGRRICWSGRSRGRSEVGLPVSPLLLCGTCDWLEPEFQAERDALSPEIRFFEVWCRPSWAWEQLDSTTTRQFGQIEERHLLNVHVYYGVDLIARSDYIPPEECIVGHERVQPASHVIAELDSHFWDCRELISGNTANVRWLCKNTPPETLGLMVENAARRPREIPGYPPPGESIPTRYSRECPSPSGRTDTRRGLRSGRHKTDSVSENYPEHRWCSLAQLRRRSRRLATLRIHPGQGNGSR